MNKENKSQQDGQSFLEFLLTLFAFLTVAFMTVQVGLSFGIAHYIQYATFMAARAMLSSDKTPDLQQANAKRVLERMIQPEGKDRFASMAKGKDGANPTGATYYILPNGSTAAFGGQIGAEPRDTRWAQGVSYKFSAKLYMMPLVRTKTSKEGVELESQTFLGREPSTEECLQQIRNRKAEAQSNEEWVIDNGC